MLPGIVWDEVVSVCGSLSRQKTYRANTSHIIAGDQACVTASTCLTPSCLSSEPVSESSSTIFPFSTTVSERALSSWIPVSAGTEDEILRTAMLNRGLLAESQRSDIKIRRCGQPQELSMETARPSYITAPIPRDIPPAEIDAGQESDVAFDTS